MFNTRKSISRRTLLRGTGAAFALPLLDAMIPGFGRNRGGSVAAPSVGLCLHADGF